jgi:hypothetical protein
MREIIAHTEYMDHEIFSPAEKPVYSIMDFTGVTRLPSNLLDNAISRMKRPHPMSHGAILVIDNVFVRTIANIAISLSHTDQIMICRTCDEAWREVDRLLEAEKVKLAQ